MNRIPAQPVETSWHARRSVVWCFEARQLQPWKEVAIRPIAPGIALVTALGDADGFTRPDGRVSPLSTSILTFVFVQKGGRWLITEAYNTTVDPVSAPNNPIQHAAK